MRLRIVMKILVVNFSVEMTFPHSENKCFNKCCNFTGKTYLQVVVILAHRNIEFPFLIIYLNLAWHYVYKDSLQGIIRHFSIKKLWFLWFTSFESLILVKMNPVLVDNWWTVRYQVTKQLLIDRIIHVQQTNTTSFIKSLCNSIDKTFCGFYWSTFWFISDCLLADKFIS